QMKYENRLEKVFWRGVGGWKRDWLINITFKYPQMIDIKEIHWKKNIKGFPFDLSNSFTKLENHCHYKYLAHLEGNSYSARLKYLLLCASPVIHSPIQNWQEFWYHLLINQTNILFYQTNPLAFNQTIHLLTSNQTLSQQIGQNGQNLVKKYLNEHAINCYWWKLIQQYSKLISYKPVLHQNAVHFDDFILLKSTSS
ncbi:unnamed protein product, partial [Adineta ricciae]